MMNDSRNASPERVSDSPNGNYHAPIMNYPFPPLSSILNMPNIPLLTPPSTSSTDQLQHFNNMVNLVHASQATLHAQHAAYLQQHMRHLFGNFAGLQPTQRPPLFYGPLPTLADHKSPPSLPSSPSSAIERPHTMKSSPALPQSPHFTHFDHKYHHISPYAMDFAPAAASVNSSPKSQFSSSTSSSGSLPQQLHRPYTPLTLIGGEAPKAAQLTPAKPKAAAAAAAKPRSRAARKPAAKKNSIMLTPESSPEYNGQQVTSTNSTASKAGGDQAKALNQERKQRKARIPTVSSKRTPPTPTPAPTPTVTAAADDEDDEDSECDGDSVSASEIAAADSSNAGKAGAGVFKQPNNKKLSPEKTHFCEVCGRGFGYKHVLQNHERTHTGEKPFECGVCQKRFTRDHHLKTHMRLHTGEKPYHCDYCERDFVQVANLRRHQRIHTGDKPYKCDVCKAEYADGNQLKAHRMQHSDQELPHTCAFCPARFKKPAYVKSHRCKAAMAERMMASAVTALQPLISPPMSEASDEAKDDMSSAASSCCSDAGSEYLTFGAEGGSVQRSTSPMQVTTAAPAEQAEPEDLSMGTTRHGACCSDADDDNVDDDMDAMSDCSLDDARTLYLQQSEHLMQMQMAQNVVKALVAQSNSSSL